MTYLNPFGLLGLAVDDVAQVSDDAIKAARKRLLVNIELEGSFEWNGIRVSKSDALAALTELDDSRKRRFHLALSKNHQLMNFLMKGSLQFFEQRIHEQICEDPTFAQFISPWFVPQYNRALLSFLEHRNSGGIRMLLNSPMLPISSGDLDKAYHGAYQYLKDKTAVVINHTNALKSQSTSNPALKQKIGRLLREIDVKSLNALPGYFGIARAELANSLRTFSIEVHNSSDEMDGAVALISKATDLISDPDLKSRLETDLIQLRENQLKSRIYTRCWFCATNPRKEGAERTVAMHKVTDRYYGSVNYSKRAVNIPRCQACRKAHIISTSVALSALISGLIYGMLTGELLVIAFLSVMLGGCAGTSLRRFRKSKSKYEVSTYPVIAESLMDSWEFGETPSTFDVIGLINAFLRTTLQLTYHAASHEPRLLRQLPFQATALFAIGIVFTMFAVHGTSESKGVHQFLSPGVRPPAADKRSSLIESSQNTPPERHLSETPPASATPSANNQDNSRSHLGVEIETSKEELRSLESQLKTKDVYLNSLSKRIESMKRDIAETEEYARLGISVDESEYRQMIDNHNSMVSLYNAELMDYRKKASTYKQKLDATNRRIDTYNGLH